VTPGERLLLSPILLYLSHIWDGDYLGKNYNFIIIIGYNSPNPENPV
jgi:hypothetical protein